MNEEFKFGTWYPIETGPKDETYGPHGHALQVIGTDGRFVFPIFGGYMGWEWPDDGLGNFDQEKPRETPTHWMPLPPPPVTDPS